MRKTGWIVVVAAVALVLAFPVLAATQEHLEQQEQSEAGEEHPEQEHPEVPPPVR